MALSKLKQVLEGQESSSSSSSEEEGICHVLEKNNSISLYLDDEPETSNDEVDDASKSSKGKRILPEDSVVGHENKKARKEESSSLNKTRESE